MSSDGEIKDGPGAEERLRIQNVFVFVRVSQHQVRGRFDLKLISRTIKDTTGVFHSHLRIRQVCARLSACVPSYLTGRKSSAEHHSISSFFNFACSKSLAHFE